MRILLTGVAGFIGSTLAHRLLAEGHEILGVDNLNEYYDVTLKRARLERLQGKPGFQFTKLDIADRQGLLEATKNFKTEKVVHLAAQAGVRYSLTNPYAYSHSNLEGFLSILEACRQNHVQHLIYASTSSVYGLNTKLPFSSKHPVDHPASLYAATKRANEMMAHSYAHMYGLPTTGLRFFTVYGPWGRPDMALFLFTERILKGEPIEVFNGGNHQRDFTYVEDIVSGVASVTLGKAPTSGPASLNELADAGSAPHRIYNIGNNKSEPLNRYIEILETVLGKKAEKIFKPLQAGDVVATHADISELKNDFGYNPSTSIDVGIQKFVEWYRSYYRV